MSLVEQELPTLSEYLSSPPVFSGVHVTRFLVLCVCFVDRCLSFYTFSIGMCVGCSSSIYGFWLPFWYLQTLVIFGEISDNLKNTLGVRSKAHTSSRRFDTAYIVLSVSEIGSYFWIPSFTNKADYYILALPNFDNVTTCWLMSRFP
jgi:hypothetical protein